MAFCVHHLHDQYSLLDGVGNASQYIKKAKELGIDCLCITNHGNMSSYYEWYTEGKKNDFKIGIGQEFYFEEDNVIFASEDLRKTLNRYYHLVIIAKNNNGLQNLKRLSSLAYDKSRFYHKPRIATSDLLKYKDDLIITSACIGGPIAKNLLAGDFEKVNRFLNLFVNNFGNDFFLEINPADTSYNWNKELKTYVRDGFNTQEIVNRAIIDLAKDRNIKVVIGQDVHIVEEQDKEVQDTLSFSSKEEEKFTLSEAYFLRNKEQLREHLKIVHSYITDEQYEEFCENGNVFLQCEYDIPKKLSLPSIENSKKILLDKCIQNGKELFKNPIYLNRFKYEFNIICNSGIDLSSYFLILADIKDWCMREKTVTMGCGRGSAVGCLVSYLLGITTLDPIKYKLSFERFLTLARLQEGHLPDIDCDFSDRDLVIEYLQDKYGKDNVSGCLTFSTIKTKSAFKDAIRVKIPDMDFNQSNILTQALPSKTVNIEDYVYAICNDYHIKLPDLDTLETEQQINAHAAYTTGEDQDVDKISDFVNWYKTHPKAKETIAIANKMLGTIRHKSTHASATLIADKRIDEISPTTVSKGTVVSQIDGTTAESIGLVKFDVLGLSTLTHISECIKNVKRDYNIDIDFYNIPLDVKEVYDDYCNLQTSSVFQTSSNVCKKILKAMQPRTLEEISLVIALGRPGPLANKTDETFIKNKNDPSQIETPEILREALSETHGVLIFQEQLQKCYQILCNISAVEAEALRGFVSKKKMDKIVPYKDKMIIEDEDERNKVWSWLINNSSYLFNASHSIAYSYISYTCMYLKKFYPHQWWSAVLSNSSDKDIKEFCKEIAQYYEVVSPDIQLSNFDEWKFENNKVFTPLNSIKGISAKSKIFDNAPYKDIEDFYNKNLETRSSIIEALIFSGALDSLCADRVQNLYNFKLKVFEYKEDKRIAKLREPEKAKRKTPDIEILALDELDLRIKKSELLPSAPLTFSDLIYDKYQITCLDLSAQFTDKLRYTIAGIASDVVRKYTKHGKTYYQITLTDSVNSIQCKIWDCNESPCKKSSIIVVDGKINEWNGKQQIIVSSLATVK